MQELLSKLNGDAIILLTCLVLCFVAGLTVWLSLQWRLHRRTELEVTLKQDMLNRGLSAEEIERILKASTAHTDSGNGPHAADSSWANKIGDQPEDGKPSTEDGPDVALSFRAGNHEKRFEIRTRRHFGDS